MLVHWGASCLMVLPLLLLCIYSSRCCFGVHDNGMVWLQSTCLCHATADISPPAINQ